MKFTRSRSRIARIIVAACCALGIVVAASAAIPAPAAQAQSCVAYQKSGSSNWWVNFGCNAVPIPGSHVCQAFDNGEYVDGAQAVECADVYVTTTGGYGTFWGEGEFYCQGPNGYIQCAGMNVNVDFTGTGQTEPAKNYKCNPDVGACTTGKAMWSSEKYATLYGGNICIPVTGFLPAGNVISVKAGYAALHDNNRVSTPNLTVCYAPKTS
ncbi:MAG TPA: hypothetical protein VIZ20_16370 [Streptosporangiaceae bacterium]